MAGKISKANVKFVEIEKYSWNTWQVTFELKSQVNYVLPNNLCASLGFDTYILGFKLFRKGVIREVPLDMAINSLAKPIENENPYIRVENIFRLKRRNRFWEDSELIVIVFKGEVLSSKIKIWKTVMAVYLFVANVRLCFKGKIGHISKYYDKEECCLTCAGFHPKDINYASQKKCINCLNPHGMLDRRCLAYLKSVAIARVIANDNLPYLKTMRVIDKGVLVNSTVPCKDQRNFPSLVKENSSFAEVTFKGRPSDSGKKNLIAAVFPTEVKQLLNGFVQFLPLVQNPDKLVSRLWKTIELHITISQSQNGSQNNEMSL